jgi:hypothetical protein
MALNTWWDSEPGQRFWMEITQRDVLGEDLIAPKLDGGGREQWSYALVSKVQPGDRVLHYQTNAPGGGAIVGWSEAVDTPSTGTITWQARGTRGRERGRPTTGPSWFVPLGGLHEFDSPVMGRDLSRIDSDLFRLRDQLEARHGKPIYFPFFRYRAGEVRAQQGYLVKFPEELIGLLPRLESVRAEQTGSVAHEAEEEENRPDSSSRTVPRGRTTRIQDPVLRKAIEDHAVAQAVTHYRQLGCTEWTILGKPYDIKLSLNGEERHIEVKGSSLEVATVELTTNEVTHADDYQPTDLVVVDGIDWTREEDGTISTSGGQLRIWTDWTPEDENLFARTYAYNLGELPDHGSTRASKATASTQ